MNCGHWSQSAIQKRKSETLKEVQKKVHHSTPEQPLQKKHATISLQSVESTNANANSFGLIPLAAVT
jgi:hypothetical protein